MKKKFGFSLAEALITLLIVCLITLATVPVLTKKKRTVNSASGQWICTKRAVKDADGKITKYEHVFWSSRAPEGTIDNPDTWSVSGDGTSCVFMPPVGAKNFAVTLIGGGGGGADGQSEKREVLSPINNGPFVPEESGIYNIALIGGGGGGQGSDDGGSSDCGGGGGAGGYWFGQINLLAGENYYVEKGSGGQGIKDDEKAKYGPYAGSSKFKAGSSDLVVAGGGQGGRGTGKDITGVWGGQGGFGGCPITTDALKKYTYNVYKTGCGNRGGSDKILNVPRKPGAVGTHINNEFWGSKYDIGPFGSGGAGYCSDIAGERGASGAAYVWQIIQKNGLGGSASDLLTISVPNIKGKAVVTVGDGGAANENGGNSYFTIYNNQGGVISERKSPYGKAGEKGKEVGSAEYVDGTKGQDSFWIKKGGGAVGQCHGVRYTSKPVPKEQYVYETDDNGDYICEIAFYELGWVSDKKNFSVNDPRCPLSSTTNPKGACFGYTDPDCEGTSGGYPKNCHNLNRKAFFEKSINVLYKDHDDLTPITYNEFIGKMASIYKKTLFSKPNAYGYEADFYYGLDEENHYACYLYKSRKETVYVTEPTKEDAGCEDSKDGTYFGAGGGGGSSSNTVGMYGKGGRGAPGAVIIEW